MRRCWPAHIALQMDSFPRASSSSDDDDDGPSMQAATLQAMRFRRCHRGHRHRTAAHGRRPPRKHNTPNLMCQLRESVVRADVNHASESNWPGIIQALAREWPRQGLRARECARQPAAGSRQQVHIQRRQQSPIDSIQITYRKRQQRSRSLAANAIDSRKLLGQASARIHSACTAHTHDTRRPRDGRLAAPATAAAAVAAATKSFRCEKSPNKFLQLISN